MGFGEILQGLRERAGLSQSQLATRSGTPLDSLRNWEQNRTLPKIDAVTRLARALGVSLDALAYTGEEGDREDPAPGRPRRGKPSGQDAAPPAKKPRGKAGK